MGINKQPVKKEELSFEELENNITTEIVEEEEVMKETFFNKVVAFGQKHGKKILGGLLLGGAAGLGYKLGKRSIMNALDSELDLIRGTYDFEDEDDEYEETSDDCSPEETE